LGEASTGSLLLGIGDKLLAGELQLHSGALARELTDGGVSVLLGVSDGGLQRLA
jgi:hypothetical protein